MSDDANNFIGGLIIGMIVMFFIGIIFLSQSPQGINQQPDDFSEFVIIGESTEEGRTMIKVAYECKNKQLWRENRVCVVDG